MPTRQPTAEETFAALIVEKAFRYFAVAEVDLRNWAEQLQIALALGIAKCDEIRLYNQKAVELYMLEALILKSLNDIGAQGLPTTPGMPAIFGSAVGVVLDPNSKLPQVSIDLRCGPTSVYVDASTRSFMTPCEPSQPLPPLSAAPAAGAIAACAAAPWVCAALVTGGLAAGVLTLVILKAGTQLISATLQNLFNADGVLNNAMADKTAKIHAARQKAVNECLVASLAKLAPNQPPEVVLKVQEGCDKLYERFDPHYTESFWKKITPFAITATVFGVTWLVTSTIREGYRRPRVPEARAE